MTPERVYRDVSASSAGELAKAVETSLRELEAEFEWVVVLSVSHDIYVNWNGSYLWTAFITCVVEGDKPKVADERS